MTIGTALPVIAWANPADIVYGTALGGTQLGATAIVPGSFAYSPAPGTVLTAGLGQTPSAHVHAHRQHPLPDRHRTRPRSTSASHADDLLGQPREHRLRHGPERNAARRHGQRGGDVHLHAGRGDGPARGNDQTLSVTFTPADTTDYTTATATATINVLPGDADDLLGQSGEHRLRHGPERNAARRHGQRAGDVRLHAGRGDRPARRQRTRRCRSPSRPPTRPTTPRPPQPRRSMSCRRRPRSPGPIRRTSSTARP